MRWYGSLRRASEIAYVRRAGRRSSGATLAAHVVPEGSRGSWLVAITVSKAVGNAVTRNRVKRRIKGALDAMTAPNAPARIVFVARPSAAEAGYERLARDVAATVDRLRS